ncbi:DUF429 domain-containing protein [Scleromatobacter humisilvae]|uniref:DUF429 domain-containing protein n=1 Tax=Scleromatobacter humisilvae TaxID=2897159 RepID=A0A9X1YFM8_9BURK|nr:DUF429 domain-containing protein [Scleromatobacter humisilvae]MCK9684792.1 DUF429 domain-containing protein [Scleromatobacter humisilvae]
MNLAVPSPAAVESDGRALAGVDFSSAPRRGKPIVWAWGRWQRPGLLKLERFEENASPAAFEASLRQPGPWLAAFDLPFGLPRELVATLGWPTDWAGSMTHYAGLTRAAIVETFSAFCDARPVGGKFAHRACDGPAGSSPSMKWVNPPVAFMLHAGVPALRAAGVDIPGLQAGDATRVALEAYPGLVARALIGRRSYKSDTRAQQTTERLIARKDLVDALEQGRWRGLRLKLTHAQRDELVADPQGDRLDAALCLLLAGWADTQPGYGMPAAFDALEGWIVAADGDGAGIPVAVPAKKAGAKAR